MHMAVAGDVARAAGAGADRPQCLLDCREHRGVLAHAEIVVRAPHRDLGADAMVKGARKAPAAPLQIGEHAVPPFAVQRVETVSEKAFVIHSSPQPARAVLIPYISPVNSPPAGHLAAGRPTRAHFHADTRLQLWSDLLGFRPSGAGRDDAPWRPPGRRATAINAASLASPPWGS